MSLKLNSSGGGSVTLQEPVTASDLTFTLPAFSGTAATLASVTNNGVLFVNGSGQPTSGSALTFDGTRLGVNIASPTLNFEVGGNTATGYMHSGISVFSIGSKNNYPVSFDVNNTEQMRLTSTGLGIGTSSPTAKLHVNGSLKANASLSLAGMFIIASGSYNNSTANSLGAVMNEAHSIIHIVTGGDKLSSIPVYSNGGAGIAFEYNYMNPATAGWANTGGAGINFNFTCAGSGNNSYNVVVTSGAGLLSVQRTGGSAAYAVYVQRIATI